MIIVPWGHGKLHKEIILLTTSKKMGNYCIARIEKETGSWIRVISEDDKIKHAVKAKDVRYKDGKMPQVMDVIRLWFPA